MAETSIYGKFTETLLELKKKLELEILSWNEEAVREGMSPSSSRSGGSPSSPTAPSAL